MKTKNVLALLSLGALAFGLAAAAPSLEPKDQPTSAPTAEPKKPEGAAVGTVPADFTLTDTDGKTIKFSEFAKDKIVVVEWFNPGCPLIVKHHQTYTTFQDLSKEFSPKGVVFLAINSSGPGKEGYGKEANAAAKAKWNIPFPIVLDEDSSVARAWGAKCTPHTFIIGKDGKVAYNGAIDNDPGAKAGSVNYARKALNEILSGSSVTEASNRPYGCGIKFASPKKN